MVRARPRRLTLLAACLALVAIAAAVLLLTRDRGLPPPDRPAVLDPHARDPFAYSESRRAEFERRASDGYAHVVYAKSPGGVVDTAERVATYRHDIDAVARRTGVDPDALEAIVFLESAGRPDAAADPRFVGAVGLTQILSETGRDLLGLKTDPAGARKLTRQMARAQARGQDSKLDRLIARRRRIDERFDPRKSLAATARYLLLARQKLGRDDLALASYHMGIGNLQSAEADFARDGGHAPRSYAELFFASTPSSHAAAFRRLSRLGDDSSTYLWRVRASEAIMRLYRTDPDALQRTADLQRAKNSAEEVLHPRDDTRVFSDPGDVKSAFRDHDLRSFPDDPSGLGLRRDPQMGELASKLGEPRRLYRGLRPPAYALAAYLVRLSREGGAPAAPLTVTSTVRDQKYQRLLVKSNLEATQNYSLHTTGWTFDFLRRYADGRQAAGVQFALDRLQALDLIAWVREPAAIHVTVGSDAKRLVPLLRPQ
jgi:soluble lytic murein transglycosylase-like protein